MRVLGWLGYDNVAIEEDGAYLHIDLGAVADAAEIARIRHVVLASLPAHMRFYRVFFAFDLRPIRLDRGPPLDVGMLDNDSGVWPDGGDVKGSFGTGWGWQLPDESAAKLLAAVLERACACTLHDDISWRLDAWRLDAEILLDASGGAQTIAGAALADEPDLLLDVALTDLRGGVADEATEGGVVAALDLHIAEVAPSGSRGWRGPWVDTWRELIPHKHTELPED